MDGKIDYKAKARPFSVIDAFRGYVERVCAIPGMKAILVDSEAMAMLSLVESQTNIIGKQVFIVERIDAQKAKSSAMQHLKAVCLLRPNRAGIEALCKSLRSPKYREYHVFFTNFASDADLRTIAVADEHELVKQVQEYYADFYAVNHDLWHVGEMSSRGLTPNALTGQRQTMPRTTATWRAFLPCFGGQEAPRGAVSKGIFPRANPRGGCGV